MLNLNEDFMLLKILDRNNEGMHYSFAFSIKFNWEIHAAYNFWL